MIDDNDYWEWCGWYATIWHTKMGLYNMCNNIHDIVIMNRLNDE
jgi:hypothetical protein